jgi:hypothetical protein
MRFSPKRCCISAPSGLPTRYQGVVFSGNPILGFPFKTALKTPKAEKKLGLNHQRIEF